MNQKLNKQRNHFLHTLGARFSFSFFILALAIITASCSIGYYVYRNNIERLYNAHIYSVAYQARSMVDGDTLAQYLTDGAATDSYRKLKADIETLRQNMDAISIFIVQVNVPSEGSYLYLLDTFADHDFENQLGAVVPYPREFKEQVESIYYDGADGHDQLISMDSAVYGLNFFAAVPVYQSDGQITAALFVQSSVEQIHGTLRQYLVYAVGLTILLVILFLLVYMSYLNHNVVTPIKTITRHASGFVSSSGISTTLAPFYTGDEIETLSKALAQMETDIQRYTEHLTAAAAAKEHAAAELSVAKQIQQSLFPYHFPAFPGRKDFDIYAFLQPCDAIGGNFYNFFLLNDNTLCLYLGDVAGNGIPACMFSAIAATLIGNYASLNLPPERILANVNNDLSRGSHAELTAHVFLAVIDLTTGQLHYATAGNTIRAFLKSPGQAFAPLPDMNCFPLAAIEQVHYTASQVMLSQGDVLFLHTGGIADAVNSQGLSFGTEYAKEAVFNFMQQEYSLKDITDQFFQLFLDFTNGAEQTCDGTVLLFRYNAHP